VKKQHFCSVADEVILFSERRSSGQVVDPASRARYELLVTTRPPNTRDNNTYYPKEVTSGFQKFDDDTSLNLLQKSMKRLNLIA